MRCAPGLLLTVVCALGLSAPAAAVPPIKHVFVIVLENENADTTFAANSPAPYLAKTLPAMGELVPNYFGTAHLSLPNYIAMVSGQGPNPQTQSDCQRYVNVTPGVLGSDDQAMGQGCIYPRSVLTIADQLATAGLSWKGYMEDMGADATRDNGTTCAHPAVNSGDATQSASAKDQYATRHNPFVYFHSIIDGGLCADDDVPLSRLSGDLASAATTPSLAFITPDLCHDGHDATCADATEKGGLAGADDFLKLWVPRILDSPAYQEGGLVVVTFDEADANPPGGDATSCCNSPNPYPNTPNAGGPVLGPGGGRVGAVLLSPFILPGSTTTTAYNHYALLRSMEDLFGLAHLGYAARSDLRAFGDDVYTVSPSPAGQPAGSPPDGSAGSPPDGSPGSPTPPTSQGQGPAPVTTSPVAAPARCHGRPAPTQRGRLPRGALLQSVRVRRGAARRVTLAIRLRHGARLRVAVGRRRPLTHRYFHACLIIHVRLPGRHGTAHIRASLRGRAERRTVRY